MVLPLSYKNVPLLYWAIAQKNHRGFAITALELYDCQNSTYSFPMDLCPNHSTFQILAIVAQFVCFTDINVHIRFSWCCWCYCWDSHLYNCSITRGCSCFLKALSQHQHQLSVLFYLDVVAKLPGSPCLKDTTGEWLETFVWRALRASWLPPVRGQWLPKQTLAFKPINLSRPRTTTKLQQVMQISFVIINY